MKQMIKANVTAEREDANMITIPLGAIREVPVGYQEILYGALAVSGNMVVNGFLVVDAIPT